MPLELFMQFNCVVSQQNTGTTHYFVQQTQTIYSRETIFPNFKPKLKGITSENRIEIPVQKGNVYGQYVYKNFEKKGVMPNSKHNEH